MLLTCLWSCYPTNLSWSCNNYMTKKPLLLSSQRILALLVSCMEMEVVNAMNASAYQDWDSYSTFPLESLICPLRISHYTSS